MPGSFPQIVQSRAYWAQGKYDEAEPLYWRALYIFEQHSDRLKFATILGNIADLYLPKFRPN